VKKPGTRHYLSPVHEMTLDEKVDALVAERNDILAGRAPVLVNTTSRVERLGQIMDGLMRLLGAAYATRL
jgi:hypothetical protein